MKINAINYNWYSTPENGEEFQNATVGILYGNKKCDGITEHPCAGEGDKWYYDIYYSDGTMDRIFNVNKVFFVEK